MARHRIVFNIFICSEMWSAIIQVRIHCLVVSKEQDAVVHVHTCVLVKWDLTRTTPNVDKKVLQQERSR